jgi:hypothetical protein
MEVLEQVFSAHHTVQRTVKRSEAARTVAAVLYPGALTEDVTVRQADLVKLTHEGAGALNVAAAQFTSTTTKAQLEAIITKQNKVIATLQTVANVLGMGVAQMSREQQEAITSTILQSHTTIAETVNQQSADVAKQLAEQQPEVQRVVAAAVAPLQKGLQEVAASVARLASTQSAAATAAAATAATHSAQAAAARGHGFAAAAFRGEARAPAGTAAARAAYPPPSPPPQPPEQPPRRRTDMQPSLGYSFVRLTLAKDSQRKFSTTRAAAHAAVTALLAEQHMEGDIPFVDIQHRRTATGTAREVIAYIAEVPRWVAEDLVDASRFAAGAGVSGWQVRWHWPSQDFAVRMALREQFKPQLEGAKRVHFHVNLRSIEIDGQRYTLPPPVQPPAPPTGDPAPPPNPTTAAQRPAA